MGIASSGFWVVPRLGKQRTTAIGAGVAAACLGFILNALQIVFKINSKGHSVSSGYL
jgi:hypothetical protein